MSQVNPQAGPYMVKFQMDRNFEGNTIQHTSTKITVELSGYIILHICYKNQKIMPRALGPVIVQALLIENILFTYCPAGHDSQQKFSPFF